MASNYPTSLDTFTNPSAGASLSSPSHSTQHGDANDAIEAIEAKLGIGSSAATSASNGMLLTANGSGGSSWSWGTGRVLQVVNVTYATEISSSSTTYADTGLSASITPKSSSSKVLIMVSQNGLFKNSTFISNGVMLKLFRGTTEINFFGFVVCYTGTAIENYGAASVTHLDSPATTSSVTYKTQFANWQNQASVKVQAGNATSTMTLLEISA